MFEVRYHVLMFSSTLSTLWSLKQALAFLCRFTSMGTAGKLRLEIWAWHPSCQSVSQKVMRPPSAALFFSVMQVDGVQMLGWRTPAFYQLCESSCFPVMCMPVSEPWRRLLRTQGALCLCQH